MVRVLNLLLGKFPGGRGDRNGCARGLMAVVFDRQGFAVLGGGGVGGGGRVDNSP